MLKSCIVNYYSFDGGEIKKDISKFVSSIIEIEIVRINISTYIYIIIIKFIIIIISFLFFEIGKK